MKRSLDELRQEPSRTAWRSAPLVGAIVSAIVAAAVCGASFFLRGEDDPMWMYPAILILMLVCIAGYAIYSFRRIIRLLAVGILVEAKVDNRGMSMKGLSDLKFQYEYGGVVYRTTKSVASSEAKDGVASGVVFILIDPNAPKKYVFVNSLYGLE